MNSTFKVLNIETVIIFEAMGSYLLFVVIIYAYDFNWTRGYNTASGPGCKHLWHSISDCCVADPEPNHGNGQKPEDSHVNFEGDY